MRRSMLESRRGDMVRRLSGRCGAGRRRVLPASASKSFPTLNISRARNGCQALRHVYQFPFDVSFPIPDTELHQSCGPEHSSDLSLHIGQLKDVSTHSSCYASDATLHREERASSDPLPTLHAQMSSLCGPDTRNFKPNQIKDPDTAQH